MPFVHSLPRWGAAACVAGALASTTPRVVAAHVVSAPVVSAPDAAVAVVGVVRDAAGQPLGSVQVIIARLNRIATTNDAGEFRFTALPAGTYHLTTQRIGYAPGHADVTVPAAGGDVQVTITVAPAAVTLTAVQVSATATGGDPRDVPQSVTTLSGTDLSRQMAGSVAQTLSREPGVSMRYNGPAATAPVLRGFQGERVLVLQDGDRSGDLSATAPDHGVSIDPLTAQRIEVVRGPASLLYGNQALGGVVNVISNDIPTTIPTHVDGYLAGQAESATPGGGLSGGVNVPLGQNLALVLRGGGRRTEDLRGGGGAKLANSFSRNYNGVGGIGFAAGNATGGLVYRGYAFDYGLPSAEGERAKIDGHRHEIVGRSEITLNAGALTSLRVGGTAQWYSHAEINQETGERSTAFNLKTQTLDLLARTRLGRVNGAVGASGLFRQYGATGDETLTPPANSRGLGAFVFQELPLTGDASSGANPDARVAKLQVGGRLDAYRIDVQRGTEEKFGRFTGERTYNQASASVGVSVPLGTSLTFATSAARAFRAPSVEELASNAFHEAAGTYDVGNPALKAEVNQGLDAVLRLERRGLTGQLAAFYNDVQNYILPNIVGDTTVQGDEGMITVPLNRIGQADARLRGVEGRLEAEVVPHVVLGGMGDMVRGSLAGSGTALPFMPAARLGGLFRWDDGKRSLEAQYRHAFAQDRVPPSVSDDDPAGFATGAYDLLDVSAGLTVNAGGHVGSIVLRVDNVLDQRYADATSRIKTFAFNPGRNFSMVYRVIF